ncbi:hypothetical protein [Micromonospora endolithica]|uniref:hypothetical protein n=1 Tax=Micromonospora endolithica TaxID=230091 RepID=UPI0011AE0820|nr:hypothetical protein [Micromonospora endolithica]TWJ24868.1 hypothetical protein JD76_05026 [Micromonospora endolithica]
MARQGWGGSAATAVGVAAGAGAAQLGFGYGLGIIDWAPPEGGTDPATWVAGLIWATWIAATSTVFGAVCAQRLRDRASAAAPAAAPPAAGSPTAATAPAAPATPESPAAPESPAPASPATGDRPVGRLGSVLLAVAAAVGASIAVLLVAVPARMAVVPDTTSPRNVAATYAAVGLLLGVLTAVWALRSRAAATNVLATVGWLWALAVVAVLDGVLAGRGLTSAQLGIWQLSADDARFWIRDWFYWPGALLSLGSALLIGALAARSAARRTDHRVGATASGAAGPLLVAVAYLLAVPGLTTIDPQQVSAHLIAPYAVIVGIGGSVLVSALAQRAARRTAARDSAAARAASAPVVAGETTDDGTPEDVPPTEPKPTGPVAVGRAGAVRPTPAGRGGSGASARDDTVEVTPILTDPPAPAPTGPAPAIPTQRTGSRPAGQEPVRTEPGGVEPAGDDGSDPAAETAPPAKRPRAPRRAR